MSSIQGDSRPTFPGTSSHAGRLSPDSARAQGLPDPSTLDFGQIEAQLAAFLKAGFEVNAAGQLVVKDTAEVVKAQAAGRQALALEAALGGEAHLAPVSPPKVELTPAEKTGAESFAANLDLALNEVFLKLGRATAAAGGTDAATGTAAGAGTQSVADADLRQITELSAEMLLAAFLKLNITDPNNSVEMHNKLHEMSSKLRDTAIKEAKDKLLDAAKQLQEAKDYAAKAGAFAKIAQVVMIVAAIVASIFTFGVGGALILGMSGYMWAFIIAAVAAAVQIANAAAQKTASDKASAASETQLEAKSSERLAEMFQKTIEEQSAIIKLIMEAKNQTVDAVLKMLNAMFATSSKLMSAQMAR